MASSRGVIGIDASRLSAERLTGTETYTDQLLRALARLDSTDRFELYLNAAEPPAGAPELGDAVCIPFPRLWTHLRLSFEMARRRPSVLFVPAHVVPLVHPRTVVTIHDLGYLHHPEAHPASAVRMLDWTTRWSIRAARRVIAISDTTKRDLIERYGLAESKIVTIHHGVASVLEPQSAREIQRLRATYSLPERFALAVGTVQPRKNYVRLVEAAHRADIPLVVAGTGGWMADDVERDIAANGLAHAVRWLGYVPDSDLPPLYGAASVVCQVSLYEGFGMPLIEAMACGAPVVAANRSSLPEIAGGAAILVDPFDVAAITEGIRNAIDSEPERLALIERGLARASHFSWDRCARETLAVLRAVRDE